MLEVKSFGLFFIQKRSNPKNAEKYRNKPKQPESEGFSWLILAAQTKVNQKAKNDVYKTFKRQLSN